VIQATPKIKPAINKLYLIIGWMLLAIVVFIICNPAPLYFLNDDFIYISKSPELNFLYRTAFRPVSDLSLLLDYTIYGKQGWGFHISNLVFHCIGTVMVGLVGKRIITFFPSYLQSEWTPHLAAALFFVYPFHSESIFWIIGRGGSLVTIFFLAAFWLCLSPTANVRTWFFAWLFFVLGLLVYESSWLMPVAMVLAIVLRKSCGHKIRKVDFIGIGVVVITLLVSFFIRYKFIHDFIGSPYLNTTNFELGPKELIYNYATGFVRSFLPPVSSSTVFVTLTIALALLLLSTIALIIKSRKIFPVQIVLFVIFLATLTPISILGVNTHTTESERFLYLPSAFLCLFVAVTLQTIFPVSKWWTLFILLMAAGAVSLYQSAMAYRIASAWTSTSLQAIGKHPGKYKTIHLYNLPNQYKGGLIFRLGFEDALKWTCPTVQFDSISIHSRQEILKAVKLSIAGETMQTKSIRSNSEILDLNIYWSTDSIFVGTMQAK
jgi:hypothetical protein